MSLPSQTRAVLDLASTIQASPNVILWLLIGIRVLAERAAKSSKRPSSTARVVSQKEIYYERSLLVSASMYSIAVLHATVSVANMRKEHQDTRNEGVLIVVCSLIAALCWIKCIGNVCLSQR